MWVRADRHLEFLLLPLLCSHPVLLLLLLPVVLLPIVLLPVASTRRCSCACSCRVDNYVLVANRGGHGVCVKCRYHPGPERVERLAIHRIDRLDPNPRWLQRYLFIGHL